MMWSNWARTRPILRQINKSSQWHQWKSFLRQWTLLDIIMKPIIIILVIVIGLVLAQCEYSIGGAVGLPDRRSPAGCWPSYPLSCRVPPIPVGLLSSPCSSPPPPVGCRAASSSSWETARGVTVAAGAEVHPRSPWISCLQKVRPVNALKKDFIG